jgi:hypothetical protein
MASYDKYILANTPRIANNKYVWDEIEERPSNDGLKGCGLFAKKTLKYGFLIPILGVVLEGSQRCKIAKHAYQNTFDDYMWQYSDVDYCIDGHPRYLTVPKQMEILKSHYGDNVPILEGAFPASFINEANNDERYNCRFTYIDPRKLIAHCVKKPLEKLPAYPFQPIGPERFMIFVQVMLPIPKGQELLVYYGDRTTKTCKRKGYTPKPVDTLPFANIKGWGARAPKDMRCTKEYEDDLEMANPVHLPTPRKRLLPSPVNNDAKTFWEYSLEKRTKNRELREARQRAVYENINSHK